MDKLVIELLSLLRELLAGQQRLLALTLARREAMRSYDIDRLEALAEQERGALQAAALVDLKRKDLMARLKYTMGLAGAPTITEISKRVGDPQKSQLLGLAAE